ncbi:OB-fold domain-containing protein [Actinoallomurus purpureus]|uniref:Zn-ribbon domain-containing OB-fold protein n=1 Tax=Actinoallomurus purpureus TaxID=478114 RepID=UPI002093043E|nr:OB-fold domain-containing protein [Actinoallomurus purpureus]MCO6006477.1 OB-fold domain-containing protein [Actinoallomurus purpureus]
MSLAERPRPQVDRDSVPWWEAVRRHELLVQKCGGCGTLRFPPRAICGRCRARESGWVPIEGTGRVASWIVCHQVFMRAFADEVPYAVLHVRLDDAEDLFMYGDLTEGDPAEVTAGMPVEAVFTDVDEDLTLVRWRPR